MPRENRNGQCSTKKTSRSRKAEPPHAYTISWAPAIGSEGKTRLVAENTALREILEETQRQLLHARVELRVERALKDGAEPQVWGVKEPTP